MRIFVSFLFFFVAFFICSDAIAGPIIIAVASTAFTAGSAFVAGATIAASLALGAASLVLGVLSSALAPKPKLPDLSSFASLKGGGTTKQFRQAITARRLIYGEARVSGPFAYIGSTGSNEFLHMVILLASHEVEEIGEVWLNDVSIPADHMDGSGNVNKGFYDGVVRIIKHTGSPTQGADTNLVAEVTEWTTNHRLQGIAYVYVRMKYDRNKFAAGIPNVTAWVKGAQILDTRDSTTKWHHNAMLLANEYLKDSSYGIGADDADIDDTFVDSGANTCEEFVDTQTITHNVSSVATGTDLIEFSEDILEFHTGDRVQVASTGTIPTGLVAATNYYVIVYQRKSNDDDGPRIYLATSYDNAIAGTKIDITGAGSGDITVAKNAEPRYAAGGVIETNTSPDEVMTSLVASMAGKAVYAGGQWRLSAGAYVTPTITYDEDDLAGGVRVDTKISKRDRFNSVIGTYISPLNLGNPADYPEVSNVTYESEDGQKITRRIEQTFIQRASQAQRAAKIELERMRQEIVFRARFKLTAFKVQAGDNVQITNATYGWSSKAFEVMHWRLVMDEIDGDIVPLIEMALRETASTIYDWNNGEETTVDPAPNTNLPSFATVAAVTGLSFDSSPIDTKDGDIIYRLVLGWNQHSDSFVKEGGTIEIGYKLSSEADYSPHPPVDGVSDGAELVSASAGTLYDVRIRAINNLGVTSSYNTLLGVSVGSAGGVTSTEDWGAYVSDPLDSATEDWGAFVSDPIDSATEDWGTYT